MSPDFSCEKYFWSRVVTRYWFFYQGFPLFSRLFSGKLWTKGVLHSPWHNCNLNSNIIPVTRIVSICWEKNLIPGIPKFRADSDIPELKNSYIVQSFRNLLCSEIPRFSNSGIFLQFRNFEIPKLLLYFEIHNFPE